MSIIFGKSIRGKVFRLGLVLFALYLDVETPGYLTFKDPVEPFIEYLPVQNLLHCPSTELLTVPPIPGLTNLDSKELSERDLRLKLGDPICIKAGYKYYKIEAVNQKYYISVKTNDLGKVTGFKFWKD